MKPQHRNTLIGVGSFLSMLVFLRIIHIKIQASPANSLSGKYCSKHSDKRDKTSGKCAVPILYVAIDKVIGRPVTV